MLRYVNSAYVGLRKPVASLHEALIELGLRRVRSWATLLLIADAADGRRELVVNALVEWSTDLSGQMAAVPERRPAAAR
jgi:EAL and modified HD-GYP domain-containing signal transduction protein